MSNAYKIKNSFTIFFTSVKIKAINNLIMIAFQFKSNYSAYVSLRNGNKHRKMQS